MLIVAAPFTLLCALSAALAWIDIRKGIIPDWMNAAIAAIGLSKALLWHGAPAALQAALQGLAIGIVIWTLRWLYFRARGVQGLGLGDVKFLAAAGIWVGLAGLPTLLLIATLTALGAISTLLLSGQQLTTRSSLPFGPFLAVALVVTTALQQLSWCC